MNAFTQVNLPTELASRLMEEAKAMGMDLAAYLTFLESCHSGRLDPRAQDATRFMFRQHAESLRKLSQ